jgi:hypothetical protein
VRRIIFEGAKQRIDQTGSRPPLNKPILRIARADTGPPDDFVESSQYAHVTLSNSAPAIGRLGTAVVRGDKLPEAKARND